MPPPARPAAAAYHIHSRATLHRRMTLIPLALAAAFAAAPAPARPRVLGVSHFAFRAADLAKSRLFYEGLLGYAVEQDGGRLLVAVNGRQFLEVRAGLEDGEDRLDHVALETDDAEAMRRFLASRGTAVRSGVAADAAGNRAVTVRDPEGHTLELVQHGPGAWPRRAVLSRDAVS